PTATAFRQVVNAGGLGGAPPNHPDQLFWITPNGVLIPGITNVINARGGVQQIQRIEIDCTLMPCNVGLNSCLVRVPQLIQNYGFNGIPLRIFSHRDEGMGGAGQSSKRMIMTTSNANAGALQAAYNAHTDWSWAAAPWNGLYP